MLSETIGAWMIVAGVVLGTVAWIGLRVSLRYERAARLWQAWRAAARGNPWRNGVRLLYACEQCGCRLASLPPPEAIEKMKPRLLCPICMSGVTFKRREAQ